MASSNNDPVPSTESLGFSTPLNILRLSHLASATRSRNQPTFLWRSCTIRACQKPFRRLLWSSAMLTIKHSLFYSSNTLESLFVEGDPQYRQPGE
jgi:hypothetical protein